MSKACASATIVLANPPFENFNETELRAKVGYRTKRPRHSRRVIENLPARRIVRFCAAADVPAPRAGDRVRRLLLGDYEIAEISLFADKVFRYGEAESAIHHRATTRASRFGVSSPFATNGFAKDK